MLVSHLLESTESKDKLLTLQTWKFILTNSNSQSNTCSLVLFQRPTNKELPKLMTGINSQRLNIRNQLVDTLTNLPSPMFSSTMVLVDLLLLMLLLMVDMFLLMIELVMMYILLLLIILPLLLTVFHFTRNYQDNSITNINHLYSVKALSWLHLMKVLWWLTSASNQVNTLHLDISMYLELENSMLILTHLLLDHPTQLTLYSPVN